MKDIKFEQELLDKIVEIARQVMNADEITEEGLEFKLNAPLVYITHRSK